MRDTNTPPDAIDIDVALDSGSDAGIEPDGAKDTVSPADIPDVTMVDARVAESCAAYGDPVRVGMISSSLLTETSGIAASRTNPGVLYAHNDSGDTARFFAIDEMGGLLGEFTLAGATATDWEDIAIGRCGTQSCVYIGDIGDNLSARTEYAVYRAVEPRATVGMPAAAAVPVAYERFPFVYPDGPHNAETLLVHPTTGDLYVVLKVPTVSGGAVYRFPRPLVPEVRVTLERVGDFGQTACGALLTGGDIHPAGDRVILRGRGQICELRQTTGAAFDTIFATTASPLPVAVEVQGEAVAYDPDGLSYFTTSEGAAAPIYRIGCFVPTADGGVTDAEPTDGSAPDVIVDAGSLCGNAHIDPGEACDATDLGGATCVTRGFRAGALRCSASCTALDEAGCSNVRINEVESNPSPDWVEFFNPGPGVADMAGYYFTDNAPEDVSHHAVFPAGTVIPAGGFLFASNPGGALAFTFGLGMPDLARLYEPGGTVIDEISWTTHAAGTLARCPDGSETVVDVATPTQGGSNAPSCP